MTVLMILMKHQALVKMRRFELDVRFRCGIRTESTSACNSSNPKPQSFNLHGTQKTMRKLQYRPIHISAESAAARAGGKTQVPLDCSDLHKPLKPVVLLNSKATRAIREVTTWMRIGRARWAIAGF